MKNMNDRFDIDSNISKALLKAARFGFVDVLDAFVAGAEFDSFIAVALWISGVLYASDRSDSEWQEVKSHIDDFYKSIQGE